MSIQPRLNRLFAPDGKCFDVAVDHGVAPEVAKRVLDPLAMARS